MKFVVDKKEDYVIFSLLDERLTTLNAPGLRTEMVILQNEGIRNVILDLKAVNFADSSGLSALLGWNRICNSNGGVLVLLNLNEYIAMIINISKLDTVFEIHNDLQKAKDFVMKCVLEQELIAVDDDHLDDLSDNED